MNVPSGYSALDLVGFTDKGDYSASTNYVKNDLVHYDDKIWKCLIDDTTAIEPTEGVNWTLWIQQSNSLDGLVDVEITNAQDGQEITYNGTTQKWKNTSKIQTLTNQVKDMNNVYGAKNLLPNNAVTQVKNGITFTVNSDGSIRLTGTATNSAYIDLPVDLTDGVTYTAGGISGGSSSTYAIHLQAAEGSFTNAGSFVDGEKTFTKNSGQASPNNYDVHIYRIRVASGATVDTVIYPMIRLASITDNTYVPYAKSNKELTVRTDNKFRRTRKDITNYLDNLVTAIAVQDLESYGYSIGDYFVGASGYKYHLADMDTYYGSYASYAVLNTHHIGIVVQTGATAQWNTSDSTSTGYSGSNLHTYLTGTVLNNIKSDMIALFGGTTGLEHLLSHQKLLTNNVSAWAWVTDQYISALSEVQVYSSRVWGIDGYQTGEANKPLQIFQKFRFNEVFGSIWFWLRDIMSASGACRANDTGDAGIHSASDSSGVVGLILFH